MKNISIVTGGSSGLGKEISKILVKEGIPVCIIARNKEKIDRAKSEIGGEVISFVGDLSDEKFIKNTFTKLNEQGYYVNYLYNCAGVGVFGSPTEMNIEKINKCINSNVNGLMCISYEACRNMTNGGTIINIASTAGLKGNANETLYCASKWAVRGFTEAMKAYYKNSNIHIIGVYPGGMKTEFWNKECGMFPDTTKFMEPNEVAQIIVENARERKSLYCGDIVIERK